MALHIFRHVEAQHVDAQHFGQALGDFGLADAGGAREQIAADGLFRLAQAGARQLDRRGQRLDGLVLAEHQPLQFRLEVLQHRGVVLRHGLGRNARHGGDGRLDLGHADDLPALVFGHQHLRGAGLVDHVDRLVGQFAVAHVAGRKLHGGLDRVVGVADLVELLVIGLEALQDGDRIGDRGFVDVDLLEAAHQRPVLLEMLAVFLVGGGADAAQRAIGKRRLQQVRGIHGAARGGPCPDHRVDFIDEHDGAGARLDFLDHRLEAFLEIAAIAGAGQQRAHVELEDRAVMQHFRHFVVDDLARQALRRSPSCRRRDRPRTADCSSGGGRGSGWCG